MRNKYDRTANARNTPHLFERILLNAMLFGFSGINHIILYIFVDQHTPQIDYYALVFGIGMLIMVPISIIDNRIEMRSWIVVFATAAIHLVLSVHIAQLLNSWKFMWVYLFEVSVSVISIISHKFFKSIPSSPTTNKIPSKIPNSFINFTSFLI